MAQDPKQAGNKRARSGKGRQTTRTRGEKEAAQDEGREGSAGISQRQELESEKKSRRWMTQAA